MDFDGRMHIAGLDIQVPTAHGQKTYVNLDNAATTPPFHEVLEAISNFAPWYASVHRGSGFKSRLSTQLYEEARSVVRDFVGANKDEHVVIFSKNTTESINKLSYRLGLRKSDIVIISNLEHHSNDLPWRTKATVKRIRTLADGSIDHEDFLHLLTTYGKRIKLVAVSGASNVTGYMPDIYWFARQAHAVDAQIFVDCAQLAGHRSIDMRRLDDAAHIDYVAFSGHKMYAPFGCGALVGRRDTFEGSAPEYSGGGTIASVTARSVDWTETPERDEAGSPNLFGAVTLAKAIKTIQSIGMDRITEHEMSLTAYGLLTLKGVPGLRLFGNDEPSENTKRSGVIAFTLDGVPSSLVAARLSSEWGIGVRSGCFCAQPYVMSLLGLNERETRDNILQNRRDKVAGLVRISFGLYNTTADIDLLNYALWAIARNKSTNYTLDRSTGMYEPKNNPRAFTSFFAL